MQRRKSQRHARAARARWRAAEQRAQDERDAGIPDRQEADVREPFTLALASAGYRNLRIEPRLGYIAWRAYDADTGEPVACAALKQLLHGIANSLPRQLGARNFA
jgi:hypothetical protein